MKKSSNSQRKKPQQGRSKEIVASILEATVRILPQVGSRSLTTRMIAEIAGISIGSLYQYFSNKESVLGTLMDMVMTAEMEKFNQRIEDLHGKSMEETTDAMIDLALELFLRERQKMREIFMQAPELGRIPSVLNLRRQVVQRLSEEMKKHHPGQPEAEYIRVSFVAVNSVMGVIHTMLFDETQSYSEEELAKELKAMLRAYFRQRMEA